MTSVRNWKRITPDKEVICHCQTHHRSSFSYRARFSVTAPAGLRRFLAEWATTGHPVAKPD